MPGAARPVRATGRDSHAIHRLTSTATSPDALVASWLPGSEGRGVADVLLGDAPFTGRLPVSWPRTVAQEPINVGDAGYDPAFPYGWGLTTH